MLRAIVQHVEKTRKDQNVNMSETDVNNFFDYCFLKLIRSGHINGIIPNFILKNDMTSNFSKIVEVKVNIENIQKQIVEIKSETSTNISESSWELTHYDNDFEKANKDVPSDIAWHVLSQFTWNYFKKEIYKKDQCSKLKGWIKDYIRYYRLRNKTPDNHVKIIKAYKYLPIRIIELLEKEHIVLQNDDKSISYDEERINNFANKFKKSPDLIKQELLKSYFNQ